MKTTHELTVTERFTPPPFWDEKWLKSAIKELDLANMSPEERAYAERQMIKAMHELTYQKNSERNQQENVKLKRENVQLKQRTEEERREKEQLASSAIKALLNTGTSPEQIAQMLPQVDIQQIIEIKKELNDNDK